MPSKEYYYAHRDAILAKEKRRRDSLSPEERHLRKQAEYLKYKDRYKKKTSDQLRTYYLNRRRDPEKVARFNEQQRTLRAANPEKYRAIGRRSAARQRKQNPEGVLARRSRFRAAHPDYYRQIHQKRLQTRFWMIRFNRGIGKAKSKGAEIVGADSLRDYYRKVFSEPVGVCQYCGGLFSIHQITIDHKQPFVLGGRHEVTNLATSCLRCNLKKGTKPFNLVKI